MIISEVQKGNAQAERFLFNHYAPLIYGISRRYSIDDPSAKDLLQECFIHVFDKISKFNPDKGPFEAWLKRVVVNKIISLNRKKRMWKNIIFTDSFSDDDLQEDNLAEINSEELLRAIRNLPLGYRQILNLYIFEELSHKEIGKALNIKESTSRSQYFYAKKKLNSLIDKNKVFCYE